MKKKLYRQSFVITALKIMTVFQIMMLSAAVLYADVDVRITRQGGGTVTGKARWLRAAKVYKIMVPAAGGVTTEITLTPEQVEKIEVVKPKQLDQAIRMVQSKQYAAAIPILDSIKNEYAMLQWDATAAQWLVEAYVGTRDSAKAAGVAEEVVKANPDALNDTSFFKAYGNVLVETKQFSKLEKMLDDVIATSYDREAQAVAQMMRGDIQMKKGNFRDALLDGYLRTVVFFGNVRSVRPEALFKAMKCFKELGDNGKADRMRKMLMAEFPDSEFAAQAKSS